MAIDSYIVTRSVGTTRKKKSSRPAAEASAVSSLEGRNRVDIRQQDEFQSVWTLTHLIHGTATADLIQVSVIYSSWPVSGLG